MFAVEPVAVYVTAAGLLTGSLVAILATAGRAPADGAPGWDSLVAGVRFILRTPHAARRDQPRPLRSPARRRDRARARCSRARSSTSARSASASCAPRPPSARSPPRLIIARRPLRAPQGRRCSASRRLRRRHDRLRPLEVAAAVACRARGHGLRRHDQRQHPATPSRSSRRTQLRGRVNAVEMVFISASNELGAFESGAWRRSSARCPPSSPAASRRSASRRRGRGSSRRSRGWAASTNSAAAAAK